AFMPGCKADHCLILEGPQGRGKSTALRALAGDDFFTDQMPRDLSSKEASLACAGTWIIEFSELEGLMHRESQVEAVKAFLTRTEDRYRPPYQRHSISIPRQCVFTATTNRDTYMYDESGNRRFWPARVMNIHLRMLENDREQLWAEAVHAQRDEGEEWWLDHDVEHLAQTEQESR